MRQILLVASVLLAVAAPAWAEHGHGRDERSATSTAKNIANEVANAAIDEVEGKPAQVTTTTTTSQKNLPPGLQKKGKTPPGWDKGRKEGWDKTTTTTTQQPKEGIWARLTRAVIRSEKDKPAQPAQE